VIASVVRDLSGQAAPVETSVAAGPQSAPLGWSETYGRSGQRLVFKVDSLRVVDGGWRARIAMANDTTTAYDVGDSRVKLDRSYGLMLFATGSPSELDRRNRAGTLPPVREAVQFKPALPKTLDAGESWAGTISAPGALVAGSWVRVVFGALMSVSEKPPSGAPTSVVWITDHAYQLRD